MKRILLLIIILIQVSSLSAQTFTDITPTNFPNLLLGSVDLGDYDNDNDLDIIISGIDDESGTYVTTVFKNDNGTFSELSGLNIKAVCLGNVEWGDYDRDGDLDILVVGLFENEPEKIANSKIYENIGNDKFVELPDVQLSGIYHGIAKWGDYDNDGLLDIVMAGHEVTAIYRNIGNNQYQQLNGLSLPYIFQTGQVDWGDYDNDGDLDLFFAGYDGGSIGKLFRNDGNDSFIEDTSSVVRGTHRGSVKWGDYDSDGDIDLVIAGDSRSTYDEKIVEIYENKSAKFTKNESADLTGIEDGSVIWGDFNNDGLLDLFVVGYFYGTTSCLYINNGDHSFSKREQTELNILGFDCHDIACGDIDNDHDLDLIIVGENRAATKIYRNDIMSQNTIPLPPASLISEVTSDTVMLSWNRGFDKETPQNGLSYNIHIQKSGSDIVSPMSNEVNGKRNIVSIGNCSHNSFWKSSSLKAGKYSWKVQTIDNTYEASEFSVADSFNIPVSSTFITDKNEYCEDELVKLTYTGNAPKDAIFSWNLDGATIITDTVPNELYVSWQASGERTIFLSVDYEGDTASSKIENITIHPKPDGRLFGDTTFVKGDINHLFLDLNGTPPFSIDYTNGYYTNTVTTNNYRDTIQIYSDGTYRIINISDATGCSSGEIENSLKVHSISNSDTVKLANETEKGTLKKEWQFGMLGHDLGEAGIIAEDIDNNGYIDIISAGRYSDNSWEPSDFLTCVEFDKDQSKYITKKISNVINHEIQCIELYDFDKDGEKELYVGLDDGTIAIYNPISLLLQKIINISYKGEVSAFDPSNSIDCIEFGDIDNNSSTDLIVSNGDTTYILNEFYDRIYKIAYGSKYFKIGNVDNDATNEIVYSDGNIIQLSGNTVVLENSFYTSNKNTPIALSKMNEDDILDIIYSSKDTLFVYDNNSTQLIWSQEWISDYNYDRYIKGIWLYDYDGDETDDIFINDKDYDAIYCYNGKNGNKDFNIRESTSDGVANIAIADFDKDNQPEIIYSVGAGCTCADYFFLYDISTKTKEWQSRHYSGDFKAFDIGDVDNDNNLEIVSGVFGEYLKYYDHGFLNVFNAENKHIEWQNDEEIFGAHVEDFTKVKIGDIDNDGENELLLGIEYGYSSSYVYVFNSQYEVERNFAIDGMSIILDMEISDIDNDNKNELIITSGTNVGGSTHPDEWQNYIYIYDGETGDLEWRSEQLTGIGSKIGSLNVGNIDADDNPEIVALKYGSWRTNGELIVIDGLSKELTTDNRNNYTSVTLSDLNNDGRMELIASADTGKILVLNGMLLDVISEYNINCGIINAIQCCNLDSDQAMEIVLSDQEKIYLYDIEQNEVFGKSGIINSNIGAYSSLKAGNFDSDENIEIYINGNHGLFVFEYIIDSVPTSILPDYNKERNQQITCFPNPFKQYLNVSLGLNERTECTFRIVDLFGKQLHLENKIIEPGTTIVAIDTHHLQNGTYVLLINNKTQILKSFKVIKIN